MPFRKLPQPPGLRLVALLALVLLAGAALGLRPAGAGGIVNSSLLGGVAIEGTDPVAYFEDGQPLAGSSEFEHEWLGATWRFASAEHRDAFAAAPEKYAPQYGGYCVWAVSRAIPRRSTRPPGRSSTASSISTTRPTCSSSGRPTSRATSPRPTPTGRRSRPTSADDARIGGRACAGCRRLRRPWRRPQYSPGFDHVSKSGPAKRSVEIEKLA